MTSKKYYPNRAPKPIYDRYDICAAHMLFGDCLRRQEGGKAAISGVKDRNRGFCPCRDNKKCLCQKGPDDDTEKCYGSWIPRRHEKPQDV